MQLFAVLAALAFFSVQNPNDPCRCARSKGDIERDFKWADVVFVGKAVESGIAPELEHPQRPGMPYMPHIRWTRFEVGRQFKGERVRQVKVYTDPIWVCAYVFEPGTTYLVYAWRDNLWDDQLTTTRCIRTAPIDQAKEDYQVLSRLVRKGKK